MKINTILTFLCLALVFNGLDAQNSNLINSKSFSSLSFVYGWYKNPKNDKWTTKDSEIKDIDKFESYTIFAHNVDNKDVVCIMKLSTKSSIYTYDIYLIDFQDYANQISKWEEQATFRFPILKQSKVEAKKLKEINLNDLNFSAMEDLKTKESNFIFQYKFEYDDTVKFLFYTEECDNARCQFVGLNGKNANLNVSLLDTDELFDNFFYKTMKDNFIKFTDAPLKK